MQVYAYRNCDASSCNLSATTQHIISATVSYIHHQTVPHTVTLSAQGCHRLVGTITLPTYHQKIQLHGVYISDFLLELEEERVLVTLASQCVLIAVQPIKGRQSLGHNGGLGVQGAC